MFLIVKTLIVSYILMFILSIIKAYKEVSHDEGETEP